jgi:hypothetical protein
MEWNGYRFTHDLYRSKYLLFFNSVSSILAEREAKDMLIKKHGLNQKD